MTEQMKNNSKETSNEETYRLAPIEVSDSERMPLALDATPSVMQEKAEPKTGLQKVFGFFFQEKLPMESETSLFVLVSVLDLIFTILLLNQGGFRESNPVADYVLAIWGVKGMIVFKMILVCFIVIVTQIIAKQRPTTARMILYLGTFVVTLVLIHSGRLLLSAF